MTIRHLQKIILLAAIMLLPAACSKNHNNDWTFAFYLCGENSLESQQVKNLVEICRGNKELKNPNVIVFIDKGRNSHGIAPKPGTHIYKINGSFAETIKASLKIDTPLSIEMQRFENIIQKTCPPGDYEFLRGMYILNRQRYYLKKSIKDKEKEKIKKILTDCNYLLPLSEEYTNLRAASHITKKQFFSYARDNFPVKHYAFFVSGHGNGWFYQEYSEKVKSITSAKSEYNDNIDAWNLKKALLFNKPDVLVLDMCLMADIETIYQLKSSTGYLVANQSVIPSTGLNYYVMLTRLAKAGALTPEKIARETVNAYREYAGRQYAVSTIAVKFGNDFDSFCALTRGLKLDNRSTITGNNCILRLPKWSDKSMYMIDLVHYIKSCADKSLSGKLLSEFNKFVISRFSENTELNGISVFYPETDDVYNEYAHAYKNTDFAIECLHGECD